MLKKPINLFRNQFEIVDRVDLVTVTFQWSDNYCSHCKEVMFNLGCLNIMVKGTIMFSVILKVQKSVQKIVYLVLIT